ncbi:MAG: hypothetical protein V4760_00730, partial [Bdellovibrionota bacterium]
MLSIFVTAATLLGPGSVSGAEIPGATTGENQAVEEARLVREIEARLARVPQFAFLRAEAEKLGVRVYLFGGTASSFAHYVRWDLLREEGRASYMRQFFDYDFFSIYRSTQDLDIVVDGPAEKADEISKLLKEKFPAFQGTKDSWEVRLLREHRGEKRALLGDADFSNQHSDSNSTGLIELTRSGEPVVRDLRDWTNPRSRYLSDVAAGLITFYFSPKHESSARYKLGKNPPIYGVIRYLTKALQYDLDLRAEDVERIRGMISSFDPAAPGRGIKLEKADFEFWMHGSDSKVSNAKKLFQHAVDLERAWNLTEELGLRTKLIALRTDVENVDSLANLLDREPLRTSPLGRGKGATAAELGISIVAHETRSPLALESITRSKKGLVNSFISRKKTAGEAAAYGPGFYTRKGFEGAVGTGLTIRFRLAPEARLGTDFKVVAGDYVIILNRAALHVLPDSLDARMEDWFKVIELAGPKNVGLLLRLGLRLRMQWDAATHSEREQVRRTIALDLKAALAKPGPAEGTALTMFFESPIGPLFVEQAREFMRIPKIHPGYFSFLKQPAWQALPEFADLVMTPREGHPSVLLNVDWAASFYSNPKIASHPSFRAVTMASDTANYYSTANLRIGEMLVTPNALARADWIEIADYHVRHPSKVLSLIAKTEKFQSSPQWERWITATMTSDAFSPHAASLMSSPRALRDPRWTPWFLQAAKNHGTTAAFRFFSVQLLRDMPRDERWIETAKYILSMPPTFDRKFDEVAS